TITSVSLSLLLLPQPAQAMDPREAVGKIEKNLAPGKLKARYQFTNTRTDGTTTSYEIQFQTEDIDHSHGVFQKPEREKGREILRVADVLWTYLPSVGRAVRVADRDSFAGGDFSNADVMRVDWLSKYDVTLAKETPKQWIFDLTAKPPTPGKLTGAPAAYAKMRLWVDQATVQPVQQQFFDSEDTLLKTCLYGAVTDFGSGVVRPARLVMENVITHQKSEMKIVEFRSGQRLPRDRFSVEQLGK
ncbi:MAG: outer membrane lipoprotein-sorting protein, partial [Bdellovibrionota bacterium]